jgi:glycosidase
MAAPISINDPAVSSTLKPEGKKFHPSPNAWEDELFYFLLPDRFSNNTESSTTLYTSSDNGNAIKDPASTDTWLKAGNKFCGGTIAGIRSKIQYLSNLGVTALWVGPVWKQVKALETYHGYGVQNFLEVEPRFGTRQELQSLVKEAHAAGMYVILDIILNHTGNVFEYANGWPAYNGGQVYPVKGFYDAQRNPVVPFPTTDKIPDLDSAIWPVELQQAGIFSCKGQINAWDTDPEYLDGDFFDLKDVSLGVSSPINFSATPALQILTAAYKYWIAFLDIDGYRLDTVKHMGIGPTRWFTEQIHEYGMRLGKERFLIVGEIAGGRMYETVEATGLDAALGIGNVMSALWQLPRGEVDANAYFSLFGNDEFDGAPPTWLRSHILTMLDDHDQIWKGNSKERFCAYNPGPALLPAALALNLCTLGIPCIYYGSEQLFDGKGGPDGPWPADQFIRETMFGSQFGAFRTKGVQFFNQDSVGYQAVKEVAKLRKAEIALRKGRQYLREISGDGKNFGYPTAWNGSMKSVVAWSRVFDGEEIVCALCTDDQNEHTAYVTLDAGIQAVGKQVTFLYPAEWKGVQPIVEDHSGRKVVLLTVPPAGFVIFK